jgi:hypothetical protein
MDPALAVDTGVADQPLPPGSWSPELALVDPELRRVLIEREIASSELPRPLRLAVPPARPVAKTPLAVARTAEPPDRRLSGKSVAAGVCGAVLTLLAAGAAATASPRTDQAPPAANAAGPASLFGREPARAGIGAAGERRARVRALAWAPVAGASGYEVALDNAAGRVFLARTDKPAIDINVGIAGARSASAVPPGTYVWLVWPLSDNRLGGGTIVRSEITLTVS